MTASATLYIAQTSDYKFSDMYEYATQMVAWGKV
jgi:hypothetical protein